MGAKVQFDNYYSMRDLNRDSSGTSWPLHHGENDLPNGQYHYIPLPRTTPDVFLGVDKELLKQKMLEHEAVFRSQVFELHRLYRVQKDLMDEIQKKEQIKNSTTFETSSSSSPLPAQKTAEDAHKRNSSSLLFTNGVCGVPPVSDPEHIRSPTDGSNKGKSSQCGPILSQNCASPKNSEVSESTRPSKLRKMIDLQLPADEYMDEEEIEQCRNEMTNISRCYNTKPGLVDLNEPLESEETNCFNNLDLLTKVPVVSEVVPEQFVFENRHQPPGNFPPHHVREDPWPAKANESFKVLDKSRSLSGFSNLEGLVASPPPSYVPHSNLMNSWDSSWRKPSSYIDHNSTSVHATPFLDSAGLSKSSQSSAPSNGFLEAWWCRNDKARSNPTAVRNGFYHGSSSGAYNDLPASFSKAGPEKVNGNLLKETNSLDLNSIRDLNLNVPWQSEAKGEDYVSVLPWLRAKASNNEAARSRNSPNTPESSLIHDQRELHNGCEVRNVLNHQNSVASTSCNVEAARLMGHVTNDCPSSAKRVVGVPIFEAPLSEERETGSGKKRVFLDINVACDDPEEFDDDEDKTGTAPSNGVRNLIDLNSCIMEDEIPSRTSHTTSTSMEKPKRPIIDLEAPIDLEAEEDSNCVPNEELSSLQDSDESSDDKLRMAAEAIVAISTSAPEIPQTYEEAYGSEDALSWFVDIACSGPHEVGIPLDDDINHISSDSDYFEEMTLNLKECSSEEYFPNPPNFDILTVEDTGPTNVTGRARRGPMRRGRQRRDFQRDILPGLTSLARQEVTEDLQTFGGLMRATGYAWHCGGRRNSSRSWSGRGRRKAVVAVSPQPPPPPPPATPPPPRKEIPKNGEIMLEDRSLTSWGKTTRRPRRQRCPPAAAAGNPAPIPLT